DQHGRAVARRAGGPVDRRAVLAHPPIRNGDVPRGADPAPRPPASHPLPRARGARGRRHDAPDPEEGAPPRGGRPGASPGRPRDRGGHDHRPRGSGAGAAAGGLALPRLHVRARGRPGRGGGGAPRGPSAAHLHHRGGPPGRAGGLARGGWGDRGGAGLCGGSPVVRLVIHPPVEPARLEKIAAAAHPMTVVNAASDAEAIRALAEADAFFGKLTPPMLEAAPRLRWIQSPTASLEHYLFPELVSHPAVLTNMRGLFSDVIADHVMGFVLCFARNFHR